MDKTLESVCEALEQLVYSFSPVIDEPRSMAEMYGWNNPALSFRELAEIPGSLIKEIRQAQIEEISDELKESLANLPRNLLFLEQNTVPQIFSGHGGNQIQAISAYMTTLEWISIQIRPLLLWQSMQDPKAMPPMLAHKLQSMKRQLDEIAVDKDTLISDIKLIQDAKETADLLPANLLSLKDAQTTIADRLLKSEIESKKVSELAETAINHEKTIHEKLLHAEKLINQCEDAYRITTTKGLAGAFEVRANRLSNSMRLWVLGLLCSLSTGAYIGADRLELLTSAMSAEHPDIGIIAMQSILSVLSLGAPLWFAWLATKQIGQRFRLSEDYAFKASVAKAYEGYRKEAAQIDPEFTARLFNTALTRVEEPPLRLVEDSNHGSPWHELFDSPEFKKTVNMPEYRDKIIDAIKDATKQGVDAVKDVAITSKSKILDDEIEPH